jgi:hypothetical protein
MAIASNFLLNGCGKANTYDIFPWVSNLCNVVKVRLFDSLLCLFPFCFNFLLILITLFRF